MKLFRRGLVGLLVAASVVFMPTASADPDAVSAAKEKLDRIHEKSATLDAQLIETITRAEESESKLETLKQDLSAQEAKVSQLGTNLGDLAMMQLNGWEAEHYDNIRNVFKGISNGRVTVVDKYVVQWLR